MINIEYDALSETAAFSASEIERCLTLIDPNAERDLAGIVINLAEFVDTEENDHIIIKLDNGSGCIRGNNSGALLIATYKFLRELGCRWTASGIGGEHIPSKKLNPCDINFDIDEVASYRHRGIMSEGAISEKNVIDMIEFMPRVGLNTYFLQFHNPIVFFKRWYEHLGNPTLDKEECTEATVAASVARIEKEIIKRGIKYHTIGHGWTCEPFGIHNMGWEKYHNELPLDYLEKTALVNGKRGLWQGMPINTNLCYSNPIVREKITNSVVDYCRQHPNVDAVYFTLADEKNNHCECELCKKKKPTDWYFTLANLIDAKLTAEKIPTKIILSIYQEFLWTPCSERLNNEDRFMMDFAPISRSYSKTYLSDINDDSVLTHHEFELNNIEMPANVAENISFLKDYQNIFSLDFFDVDYHLMWDHCYDPGYMSCSKLLYDDISSLYKLKLNGFISCQLSRAQFPTNLPLFVAANTMWNKESDYSRLVEEYFSAEFGEYSEDVIEYLTELSKRFDPVYIRGEKGNVNEEKRTEYRNIPEYIEKFKNTHQLMRIDNDSMAWKVLAVHADFAIMYAMLLERKASGQRRNDLVKAIMAYLDENELKIQSRIDVWNYDANTFRQLMKEKMTYG